MKSSHQQVKVGVGRSKEPRSNCKLAEQNAYSYTYMYLKIWKWKKTLFEGVKYIHTFQDQTHLLATDLDNMAKGIVIAELNPTR